MMDKCSASMRKRSDSALLTDTPERRYRAFFSAAFAGLSPEGIARAFVLILIYTALAAVIVPTRFLERHSPMIHMQNP